MPRKPSTLRRIPIAKSRKDFLNPCEVVKTLGAITPRPAPKPAKFKTFFAGSTPLNGKIASF